MHRIFNTAFVFDDHDGARSYFIELQNELKNLNFMPFESERYHKAYSSIEKRISEAKR